MRAHIFFASALAMLVTFTGSFAQESLQELVNKTAPGMELIIPKGTWKEPIEINKPITIRGEDAAACIIEVVSDSPAVRIETKGPVHLEGVTIRWRRETSKRAGFPQAAVAANDAKVTLKNVRVIAPDDHARCPSAFIAIGLSEVAIQECLFEGFDFTIQFGGGARGTIDQCDIRNPGHCGITVGINSNLEVTRTIVTGSDFHGMRCTGGELVAKNNLIIANKNRGFYLGNKAARGEIANNAIIENGTGISGFGGSEVEIAHNFISDSDFAAIDMRDSCRLKIDRNAIVDNARGLVVFKESGNNQNTVLINALAGNKIETEGFEKAPDIQRVNPTSSGRATGRFVLEDARGFGLTEPEKIQSLWTRYLELKKEK